jgi:hypothetical protein
LLDFLAEAERKLCKSGQGHFVNGGVICVSGGLLVNLVEMADDELPRYNKRIRD